MKKLGHLLWLIKPRRDIPMPHRWFAVAAAMMIAWQLHEPFWLVASGVFLLLAGWKDEQPPREVEIRRLVAGTIANSRDVIVKPPPRTLEPTYGHAQRSDL